LRKSFLAGSERVVREEEKKGGREEVKVMVR
jgi:hypothetical protein